MKQHATVSRRAVLAIAASSTALPLFAQAAYPTRPVQWLVGYPPGGTVDVVTRLLARRLEALAGQPFVVENRAGAAGSIAMEAAAKAAADGHTLITLPGPVLSRIATPEIGKDLRIVTVVATGATVVAGPPTGPADLATVLAEAKKNPNAWSYATSGNGTGQHLAGELLNQLAGTHIVHVPYRGGAQAINDVVAGQVPLAVLGLSTVLPQVKAGKLRAYAVTSAARQPTLPNTPTLRELGFKDFDAVSWFAVATAAGVPNDVVNRLNGWIEQVMQSPELKETLEKNALNPRGGSPAESTAFVQKDLERWRALVRSANLALD